jgi:hypothetical protein
LSSCTRSHDAGGGRFPANPDQNSPLQGPHRPNR